MKTIDADTVEELLERREARVLNVLPLTSFEKVHIPGSESVPLDELQSRAHDILQKEEGVVVYCSGPDCQLSPRAARFLADEGFERVYDFEGGLVEWIRSGRDVIRGGERVSSRAGGTPRA